MHHAGLTRPAPPRPVRAGVALWGGRLAIAFAAFAVGTALGRAENPIALLLLAAIGVLAAAATITQLRWSLVGGLFLIVAYAPDVVASRSATHALIALLAAGALLRVATGRERVAGTRELFAFGALALAYVLASIGASDRAAAAAETLDLVSYSAVIALLLLLLDTPEWLRRAVWAIVAGVGLLGVMAIVQQVTKTYGSTYGGFASVLPDGDALRSAGPLNPNPFGQVLATSTVLAFYLSRSYARPLARGCAVALAGVCVVALVYTQSRAALIALAVAAIAVAVLQGVRPRTIVVVACAVVALGSLVLPHGLIQRVDELSDAAESGGPTLADGSLRGRASENLAGLHMWTDHPLLGVGPDNFEVHYQTYSAAIGIDQRPQERGAHNLYLESLAETGVIGTVAFLGVLWFALGGAWRARSRLNGRDALLAEGIAVALVAFLVCAITLHSAYARYEWIFLGLGLAAGCLARRRAA